MVTIDETPMLLLEVTKEETEKAVVDGAFEEIAMLNEKGVKLVAEVTGPDSDVRTGRFCLSGDLAHVDATAASRNC